MELQFDPVEESTTPLTLAPAAQTHPLLTPVEMQTIFVAGCGRSGTTLLGAMLGSHPLCLATPETKFNLPVYKNTLRQMGKIDLITALHKILAHPAFQVWQVALQQEEIAELKTCTTYAQLIKQLVGKYGMSVDKPAPAIWIDHTPQTVLDVPLLFELFPEARMLHIVRDGRAVAASVMKLDWGPNTVVKAAEWWIYRVAHGLAAELYYGPTRVKRVRYEDLVLDPETILQEICTFLQIDYVPSMIQANGFRVPSYTFQQHALIGKPPQSNRIYAWQEELTARQIELFESVADSMLTCLGYEIMSTGGIRPATAMENLIAEIQEYLQTTVINPRRFSARYRRATTLEQDSSH